MVIQIAPYLESLQEVNDHTSMRSTRWSSEDPPQTFIISLRTKGSVLGIWYSLYDTETITRINQRYKTSLVEVLRKRGYRANYEVCKVKSNGTTQTIGAKITAKKI